MQATTIELRAPLTGHLLSLDQVPDPVFSARMVGDGVGIDPTSNILLAPCDGVVRTLHGAHHAITIATPEGLEVLMHIGLETVSLKGTGFRPLVKADQEVKVGTPLIEFDADVLARKARSLVTMMVVLENPSVRSLKAASGDVEAGRQVVLTIEYEGAAREATTEVEPNSEECGPWLPLPNPHGLHARPAARLSLLAKSYQSQIWLESKKSKANARSVVALMSMELAHNDEVRLLAAGADGARAVAELTQALRDGLGEDAHAPAPEASAPVAISAEPDEPGSYRGVVASPGLALGQVYLWTRPDIEVNEAGGGAEQESQRLNEGLEKARQQISGLKDSQGIFQAHLELLTDPELQERASGLVKQGKSAAFAWKSAYLAQAEALGKLKNELLAARANDVHDVGHRVLLILTGASAEGPREFPPDCIVVAHELTPSDTVTLDRSKVKGLVTVGGGPTSHVAILARSLDMPALCAVSAACLELQAGTRVILDAQAGRLRYQFEKDEWEQVSGRMAAREQQRQKDLAEAHHPGQTSDGHHIEVGVNVASLAEVKQGLANGAEGVGLLRTEFLFQERKSAPDQAEQSQLYGDMVEALGDKRLVLRLLDIGGDKPLSYLPLPHEDNPFLGLRGVRVLLRRPDLFDTQLRAALSVVGKGRVSILVPMVAAVEEWKQVRERVLALAAEMQVTGFELGVMIEVPSAALVAEQLAPMVDFFSVGTNDLTQYTLAVDRGNPDLASLVDALHPSVLVLIDRVAQAARRHGKWLGVCGGAAGDVEAVPLLVGLGVTELSVSPPAVPTIKALLRRLKLEECQVWAQDALSLSTAGEVRSMIRGRVQ